MKKKILIFILLLTFFLSKAIVIKADWPMAGHDLQRTSNASQDSISSANPLWAKPMTPYIPSKAHLITVNRPTGQSMVYVPTADGIYALNPDDGSQIWHYQIPMPVGHSPTVVNDIMYLPVLDKTIHAIDTITGVFIWQTDKAGAGFLTSPLVVNVPGVGMRVFAGNRDGYFYSFRATDGSLDWYYQADGPIAYSAAFQTYPDHLQGVLFFGCLHGRAYALRADTGQEIWKTPRFNGEGFYSFWPVVTQDKVIFASSTNHPCAESIGLIRFQHAEAVLDVNDIPALTDAQGRINGQKMVDWLTTHPEQRTIFVLDRSTGQQAEIAPILYWGNPSGNHYPPAIGPNNLVWGMSPWHNANYFTQGRYMGWQMGTSLFTPLPGATSGLESADEPEAISIIGDQIWHNDGGDGADKGGRCQLSGGDAMLWQVHLIRGAFGSYWGRWPDFKYGNGFLISDNMWSYRMGTHGNQNPPVPLNGRVYFHRSNAVLCYGP